MIMRAILPAIMSKIDDPDTQLSGLKIFIFCGEFAIDLRITKYLCLCLTSMRSMCVKSLDNHAPHYVNFEEENDIEAYE